VAPVVAKTIVWAAVMFFILLAQRHDNSALAAMTARVRATNAQPS
jgi:hypothetical protein